jgi:hypothetical protein
MCADPIRFSVHLLSRLFGRIILVMISQSLGSEEVRIFVGPAKAAATVLPNEARGKSLTNNRGTREPVDSNALDDEANGGNKGATQQVPEKSGSTIVDLRQCWARHDND